MSTERATYVDSSALVKLASDEPESAALIKYLRRHKWLVTSALARVEVARALMPFGEAVRQRGEDALARCETVRVNDRILRRAGVLQPLELRTLDAIHLASAQGVGDDLGRIVTYDERMKAGAADLGITVISPS